MTTGLEIRAQVDSETAKALLLINGGAAVALLAFLPTILGKPAFAPLLREVVCALLAFHLGLVAAVIHNRLRRLCSLHFEQNQNAPPPCRYVPSWIRFERLQQPCVCLRSMLFMWFSVLAFVFGGLKVGFGTLEIIGRIDQKQEVSCWQLQELQKRIYRVNQCTGMYERIELNATTLNKSLKPTP
jgi:hypothetical protein